MQFFALTTLFAALAAAQSPVQMEMAPPAAGAAAATQTVMVGGTAGLVFSPPFMMAPIGTQVDFVFLQKNHSVVQSTLQTPCKAMAGGFNSGFLTNAEGSIINAPKFSVTVNDTKPIWVYCAQKQGTHCGKSMVFAVNPNPDITAMNSFRVYQESAIQQNGSQVLSADGLVAAQAAATPPTMSTVTVGVNGAAGVSPAAATESAGIAAGTGQTGTGETCSCSCACQPAAVPRADAVGNFGGWAGMLP